MVIISTDVFVLLLSLLFVVLLLPPLHYYSCSCHGSIVVITITITITVTATVFSLVVVPPAVRCVSGHGKSLWKAIEFARSMV